MKILVVVGTRPKAIKMAPVIAALHRQPARFSVEVCMTAQHRDLLDPVIALFKIPVHYDLDIMAPDQSIYQVTSRVLLGMEGVLKRAQPDVVLVHGDTTTSFAAALAAFYQRIPVGHVEAGLRTYDRTHPFPEEMNRRLGDDLCSYHYASTEAARKNLLQEHIAPEHIVVTGNTVIDALLDVAERPHTFCDPVLEALGKERRLILVTAHRRESFGAPFESICRAIAELAQANPDVEVVYPVHPNPNVQHCVKALLEEQERVHLVAPLDYLPFVHLMKRATLILTDSGGIQEEAPSLGKPVLVLRDVTERPEAIVAGTAQLVGTDYERITTAAQTLLDDPARYAHVAALQNPYGDGQASTRIVEHLAGLAAVERR